ncbi:MAG TPA: hypothetical protein VGO52_00635 [Hyphomonadaceae bacterium]|nr:hypothetical protein [Hyphomonadaceae bacterium]
MTNELTEALKAAGVGAEAIEPILRFMEDHPDIDYGSPGPLVHFVERYHRHGYGEELEQSISRRPTWHTLWMFHRVVGSASEQDRSRYIAILRDVLAKGVDDGLDDAIWEILRKYPDEER